MRESRTVSIDPSEPLEALFPLEVPITMPSTPSLQKRAWLTGLAVGFAGLAVTAAISLTHLRSAQALAQLRFSQSAEAFSTALAQRLDSYTEIAFGLRGLFIINPALTRRDFVQAVERLDIGNRHPEIKNLAFTRYVRGTEKAAFEARVRSDTSVEPQGYPQFAIRPPGERAEYFVADYLWPTQGNQGIQGLDISAQPANLASMRYAQTSAKPVASGPFDLLQETTQRTGFVLRVPVFHQAKGDAAPEARDFMGAVAVTLRMRDVVEQLRSDGRLQGMNLYLSDRGTQYADQNFAVNLPLFISVSGEDPSINPAYQRELTVFGRKWRVELNPAQPFLSEAEQNTPLMFALGGAAISLLAGAVVFMALRGQAAPRT